MIQVSKKTIKSHDSIVVLAAGPSTIRHIKEIKKYINENNSVVIGSNYNYDIRSDYTVFTNRKIFRKHNKTYNKIVVSSHIMQTERLDSDYLYINHGKKISNNISISEDGTVNSLLVNCGLACVVFSIFFSPKCILMVGFDGPRKNGKVEHFNGRTTKLNDVDSRVFRTQVFMKNLFLFIKKLNITIYSFLDDEFWGINKKQFNNIKIIK